MKRAFFGIIVWALSTGLASAELVFDKEHLLFSPKADEDTVTAKFTFTYTGDDPINVVEVDANCGCISAESDKKRYEKGDAGEIRFVFNLGSKEGKQVNRVWMSYTTEVAEGGKAIKSARGPSGEDPDEIAKPPIFKYLTVEIDIPAVVKVEPKMTTWIVGSKPEPRVVKVTMEHPTPIHLKSAKSSREDVKVEITEVKAGESYLVTLTPQSTAQKRLGMLTLVTDSSVPRHQKKLAFFSIASAGAQQEAESPGDPIIPPSPSALPSLE